MKTARLDIRVAPALKALLKEKTDNVSQYLIDNFLTLPVYDNFDKLPNAKGIYFVISGNYLLYIGQSKNVKSRIKTHNRRKQFVAFANLKVLFFEMDDTEIEDDFIFYFNPVLNNTEYFEGNNTKNITIRMPDDLLEKIRSHAKTNDRNQTQTILHFCREGLKKDNANHLQVYHFARNYLQKNGHRGVDADELLEAVYGQFGRNDLIHNAAIKSWEDYYR